MARESGGTCKVDEVAGRRGLERVDDRLCERWRGGESLRDLETAFNEWVLRSAMEAAGMEALDGEASNLYRLLTAEGVSPGERVDAEARLARHDVDPSAVRDDFVSYQTVRTHLNRCLGVDTARDAALTVDDARNTVLKLVSRTEAVAERTVDRLADGGALDAGAPSVTVSLRVACSACDDEYTFTRFLERGGCSCRTEE